MNIILLSGGSGKRLWPLSNDVRSKQFIKLFKNNDEYESMVQRVYRQITTVDADAKITIATSKSQASAIKNQLGEKASVCVEPCRRDTFPAIALAAAYLHDELGVAENEAVVVCPVENWVNKDITSLEFVENIFRLMNWNRECRYKVLGRVANSDQGLCMLFDLEEAIMFTPKPQEYTDPLTGEMKKKQMKFFPDAYKNRIGKSYNDYIADHQMNMFEDFIGYQSCWKQMVWRQEKTISLKDGMMPRKMQLSFRLKKMNKVPSRLKSVQLDTTSTWSYNTSKWT